MRVPPIALALFFLAAAPARADLLKQSEWLPKGTVVADLTERPVEYLDNGAEQSFLVHFGRLAFRSPLILGGNARRAGLSCNSCHTSGHLNDRFFVPGLSDEPGKVDVTHMLWNPRNDDRKPNPRTIPTLRGVGEKRWLGRDERVSSLREFTRHVIVVEFAGAEPSPLLLDALLAYMRVVAPKESGEDPDVEAVRLEGDIEDIALHLATLRQPLLEEDGPLAALIVEMIRGEIGLIHERFHLPAHASQRRLLEGWSMALKDLAAGARPGQFPAARAKLDELQKRIAADTPQLLGAEATSLYSPDVVRKALEGQPRR
ncbi:MAG: hypothetical protein KIT20_07340 [Alphaproteobacteria bacterium]|nr:hypothetical protein [Alphaproteobacteria bacterium]